MKNRKELRYLWVYSAANESVENWHRKIINRRQFLGYNIKSFCITPKELNRKWLPFSELDLRWKSSDPILMKLYEQLAEALVDIDVLIVYNGANVHPEFLKFVKIIKVFTCGDDPESTEILSKPLAPAFDIQLVNNIACIDLYKSWGLKNVYFWPLGSLTTLDDVINLKRDDILSGKRNIPISFVGEYNLFKKDRLDKLVNNFSDIFIAGSGWKQGKISDEKVERVYRQSQIGWNLHNSIGPINFRLYELPAYGVLQICDNKDNLSNIFELNKEVIGFDSIDECIELTNYYLKNKDLQREIAYNGHLRWLKDYHPDAVWEKLVDHVVDYQNYLEGLMSNSEVSFSLEKTLVNIKNKKNTLESVPYKIKYLLLKLYRKLRLIFKL